MVIMMKIRENEGVNDELVEEEGDCFRFVFISFFDVFIPFLFRFLTFLFCFYFVFCLKIIRIGIRRRISLRFFFSFFRARQM